MKKNYSYIIFAVILCFSAYSLSAQSGWTIYNHSNTILPTTTTFRAVAIDPSGNIWVGGSYTGLYKFNGSTWTEFSTFNSNILHDDINDILIDNTNQVWAANYKGISVYNGTNFTNYDTISAGFKGMTVYALGKDNTGKIWLSSVNGSFGYKGITTYNGSTWTNLTGYQSQIVNAEFPDFAFTSTNDAWIASNPGVTEYNTSFSFYPKAATGLWSSQSIAVDASGVMWAGGFDGLLKYSGSIWTMYDNVAFFGFTSNTFFYDILPDGNILWIATAKGLLKFDRTTSTVLANYNSTNSPLGDNCVSRIAKDASGNLWLATNIGIVKMVPSQVGAVEDLVNYPIHVYPNPCSEKFSIVQPEHVELNNYSIADIDGREIAKGKITEHETTIYTNVLSNGSYIISLFNNEGVLAAHRKIFVNH